MLSIRKIQVGDLVEIVENPIAYPMYAEDLHLLGVGIVLQLTEEFFYLPALDIEQIEHEDELQTIEMCCILWSKMGVTRWEFKDDLKLVEVVGAHE